MNPRSLFPSIHPFVTTLLILASSAPAVSVYYHVKPAIPRCIRHVLRQRVAARQRQRYAEAGPILKEAGTKPAGWPGWPQIRQFALVLTNDVETKVGLERVKAMAEMEMSLGFRSSFNFV